MHSFREVLDLLKHELCCGSLGSDLLLLELKLHLKLNVWVRWSAVALAHGVGVRSLIRAGTGTELREQV